MGFLDQPVEKPDPGAVGQGRITLKIVISVVYIV